MKRSRLGYANTMDARWTMDGADMPSLQAARSQAIAYLRERGDYRADFDACALALSELISNAMRHGPGGEVVIELDWSGALPVLSVSDCGPGFTLRISLPSGRSEGGRGLYLISQLVGMPKVEGTSRGCTVSVALPIRRRIETFLYRASA